MEEEEQEGAMRLVVTGRVQGVGFRAWARRLARELRVRGWVRNRDDGSVELEAAGDFEALRAFGERVRNGPPYARVDDVRVSTASGEIPERGFEVRT